MILTGLPRVMPFLFVVFETTRAADRTDTTSETIQKNPFEKLCF
jgi:hypothetical protein